MKKKLLFKNATQYSQKLYNEFTRFHNDKFSLSYDIFTIFILILLCYCIFVTIQSKVVPLAIIFISVFILFAGYRIINPIFFYAKESKKKAITKEKIFKFYFYENSFKIRDNLDFDKISYFSLHKVYETDKYFYLYLTKKYSFIIDKAGFTQGTAEEFAKFIKKKLWIKYHNKNSAN